MVDPVQLAADPEWVPHAIDPAARTVTFIKVDRAILRDGGFLASLTGLPTAQASFEAVSAMTPAAGSLSFIFHSGFCLSTLLAKAIDLPGTTTVLNEPGVLNSLAQIDHPDGGLVRAILDLLSRPHAGGAAVVIKPSNFVNGLIPQLLRARPDARAILMTNTVEHFLQAVVRKGLAGRQWGRQVYLKAATYAGHVFNLDMAGCAALTDLQLAGMGWLLSQYWFDQQLSGPQRDRLAVLHGERLDSERGRALNAVANHLNLGTSEERLVTAAASAVFQRDAKTGADFSVKSAADDARSRSTVTDEEIAEVAAMVATNARLLKISAPIAQTLF